MGCRQAGLVVLLSVLLALLLGLSPQAVMASAGDLDPSFGDGGRVFTPMRGAEPAALLVQPDGRLLLAGTAGSPRNDGTYDFALLRYLPDGRLDPAFGTNGQVLTDFLATSDAANAAALQPDGRIVLAGVMQTGHSGPDMKFALARYNPDGRLDSSFGNGGRVAFGFGGEDQATGLAIRSDGKILATGYTWNPVTREWSVAVAPFLPDGLPDHDPFGEPYTRVDSLGMASAAAVAPDGSIIIAGAACRPFIDCNPAYILLVKYSGDGILRDWVTRTTLGGAYERARAVTVQPDGKILVAGMNGAAYGARSSAVVLRYTSGGEPDLAFGDGGRLFLPLGGRDDTANALALQPDGKILVGGLSNGAYFLVRLNPDGTLDHTFGDGGLSFPGILAPVDKGVSGLVIQPNGRAVLAGALDSRAFVLVGFQTAPPRQPRRAWLPAVWGR